jgi:transglutaminase-like putative cysteine protease
MNHSIRWLLTAALLLVPSRVLAQGKTVAESWEAAYLQGTRSGYVHTLVQEIDQGGRKALRAVIELRLTVKRFNDSVQLAMDSGTLETPDGAVVGTFMKQYLGKNKTLQITGVVQGRKLELTLDGSQRLSPAPWDESVLGVYRQKTLFKDRAIKEGDEFSYRSFEPTVNLVVSSHVKAKGYEDVELPGVRGKRRLLRVDTRFDKIEKLQLPPYTVWLDEARETVRSEFEVPGLGKVLLYPTTRTLALAPVSGAAKLDVGIGHYVRLNRGIQRPHFSNAAVYRVNLKDEEDVAGVFAEDGRQQMKNLKGSSFELHVRAESGEAAREPGPEFTESSYFINCADSKVQEHTRKAIGIERDPWKKALRIEKWVKGQMRVRSHEALAPADQVARSLEGDCTEFAMLTAAMCRAAGIPSRTALGLVYADVSSGPVFAFHMWAEVWIDGRWRALDATLGYGRIGAAHLKIADQSWHDERSLAPLLPVVRVLGKLAIEVVSVSH